MISYCPSCRSSVSCNGSNPSVLGQYSDLRPVTQPIPNNIILRADTTQQQMAVKVYNFTESVKLHQGLHRLEKYLNLEGFLEKSLKIKSALKSTGKSLRGLEVV